MQEVKPKNGVQESKCDVRVRAEVIETRVCSRSEAA